MSERLEPAGHKGCRRCCVRGQARSAELHPSGRIRKHPAKVLAIVGIVKLGGIEIIRKDAAIFGLGFDNVIIRLFRVRLDIRMEDFEVRRVNEPGLSTIRCDEKHVAGTVCMNADAWEYRL